MWSLSIDFLSGAGFESLKTVLGAVIFTLESSRKTNTDRVHSRRRVTLNLLTGVRGLWYVPLAVITFLEDRNTVWPKYTVSTMQRLWNDKMKHMSTNLWVTMKFWRSSNVWAPCEVWQTEHQGRKYLQAEKSRSKAHEKGIGNSWVTTSTCSCFNIWWNVCLMKVPWIDWDAFW